MSLIVTRDGQPARRLEPSGVPQETYLQDYILAHPEALPLDDLRDDLRLAIVARELPTASGPIDAVGVDDDGEVYLIETKLYRNPDKRRVVAQVLDYGAALWQHLSEPGAFRDELAHAARRTLGDDLDEILARALAKDPDEVDALLAKAERRIVDGTFRFLVLMDQLDDSLRDLIRFLNENSRFDIFGVELQFYRFDGYEAVIPKLHGSEARKEVSTSSSGIAWGEARFFADAEQYLPADQVQALRQLYACTVEHADRVTWGRGSTMGSFSLKDPCIHPTKSLFSAYSRSYIELNFRWLHEPGEPLPASVQRFADRIDALEGWSLPEGFADTFVRVLHDVWGPQVAIVTAAIKAAIGESGDHPYHDAP